jgi:hypothetical protein
VTNDRSAPNPALPSKSAFDLGTIETQKTERRRE